ncbi:MAG: ATP-binding protein [Atopobiaceae bacterium]|nr:ATP-binding protein [Atopobiaceae bacterium]
MARDFSVDFAGRIRNFTLKKKDALLPLFETIVNSLQAIEDAGKASSEGLIEVKLNRLPVLDENMSRGEITGFTVTDNGIGFDNINFESFLTSDSQLKGDRGGKGIGRFCWLKVFGDVSVDSTYREGEDLYRRQFLFSLGSTSIDDSVTDAVQKDTGTRIELRHVKREYLGYIPATGREIAERVMQHCLVYLLSKTCPTIIVDDEGDKTDINQMLAGMLETDSDNDKLHLSGRVFNLLHIKMKVPEATNKRSIPSCRLILCADNREVLTKKLTGLPAGLDKWLVNEYGFSYVGVLTSPYLDQHVSADRLSFDISADEDGMFDEVGMNEITAAACASARGFLRDFIDAAVSGQRKQVEQYVTEEAPQFRHLLQYAPEGVAAIGIGATREEMDDSLYKLKREVEKSVQADNKELIRKLESSQIDSDEYQEEFAWQVQRVSDVNESMLAEYVVHRRAILNIYRAALNRQDDGKFKREAYLHELIYPMRTTSEDVAYPAHNLWLIDERLTYSSFISSDKPFDGSAHEKRPDVMLLNYPTFVSADETDGLPYDTVTILELKRPDRDDYTDSENPIDQLLRYATKIRNGEARDSRGRYIAVNENTRMYLYAICDMTPKLRQLMEMRGFGETADGQGRVLYNPNLKATIEVLPFDKIYRDANMRNQVYFRTLGIE